MLVCIGEILIDLIGETDDNGISFRRFVGGAPFNVACAAKNMGGKVGFVGNVGNDLFGRYLADFANAREFDFVDISIDNEHNTTLAVVQLDETGERKFCFIRKNAADYFIAKEQAEKVVKKADTVCLGTLMLSEPRGVELADHVVRFAKACGKRLCIDVNYRDDIYGDGNPVPIYKKYIDAADVVKFSEEELEMFAAGKTLEERMLGIAGNDKLVCVTLGKNGSAFAYNGKVRKVGSIKVKTVDTTGAGDAFYGCLLAQIDGKDLAALSTSDLEKIFFAANKCGAIATTKRGAIDALPNYSEVFGE